MQLMFDSEFYMPPMIKGVIDSTETLAAEGNRPPSFIYHINEPVYLLLFRIQTEIFNMLNYFRKVLLEVTDT